MDKGKLSFDFLKLKLHEYIKIINVHVNIFFPSMHPDKFPSYAWQNHLLNLCVQVSVYNPIYTIKPLKHVIFHYVYPCMQRFNYFQNFKTVLNANKTCYGYILEVTLTFKDIRNVNSTNHWSLPCSRVFSD